MDYHLGNWEWLRNCMHPTSHTGLRSVLTELYMVTKLSELDIFKQFCFSLRQRVLQGNSSFVCVLFDHLWTKQIELVPYRATKISRKTQKHLFFPLIAKLVCFSCVFCVRLREMSQKIHSNSWPIHLKRIPYDLQKKRKFRQPLYILTNKKESVVLGSFTFESSTTNIRHMLGLYVSLRNTRKRLLFLPGHKERVLSVSFTFDVFVEVEGPIYFCATVHWSSFFCYYSWTIHFHFPNYWQWYG